MCESAKKFDFGAFIAEWEAAEVEQKQRETVECECAGEFEIRKSGRVLDKKKPTWSAVCAHCRANRADDPCSTCFYWGVMGCGGEASARWLTETDYARAYKAYAEVHKEFAVVFAMNARNELKEKLDAMSAVTACREAAGKPLSAAEIAAADAELAKVRARVPFWAKFVVLTNE